LKTITHIPWEPRAFQERGEIAWLHTHGSPQYYHHAVTNFVEKVTKYNNNPSLGLLT